MGVLAGSDADVWVAANPSIQATSEACDNTDSGVWKVYKAHTHRYWDKRQPITVEVSANGTTGWAAAPTPYTFRYVGGILTWTTALTNHFVRISGYYFNVTQLPDCYDWTLDMKAGSKDTSVFQGNGWGAYTGTQITANGKISSFRVDDRLSKEVTNPMIFSLYVDKSVGARWECAGYLTSVSPSASMAGVLEQAATFDTDGQVFYSATSALP